MKNEALEEMAAIAFCAIEEARIGLEAEERGREIARLQGMIFGAREVITMLENSMKIDLSSMEGEAPTVLTELDDQCIGIYQAEITVLLASKEWIAFEKNLSMYREELQQYLLFKAEKPRDMDLCQGKERGLKIPETFIRAVASEVNRRIVEATKKAAEQMQPALGF